MTSTDESSSGSELEGLRTSARGFAHERSPSQIVLKRSHGGVSKRLKLELGGAKAALVRQVSRFLSVGEKAVRRLLKSIFAKAFLVAIKDFAGGISTEVVDALFNATMATIEELLRSVVNF